MMTVLVVTFWIASSLRSSQLVYLGEANDGHCERSEAIQCVDVAVD